MGHIGEYTVQPSPVANGKGGVMNHELMGTIDRSRFGKSFEERIPESLESEARAVFERSSLAMFGVQWVWKDSSEEVRNRFRLGIMIRKHIDPGFYI